ncbi:hypothetical protein ACFRAM_28570 [Paenibacillus sp. NPDC056722]|uniref:hypothetical protein n=1 Tax=Paenibacillus sp. NPDC056722 TaxID=3345924 RepID=UPI00368D1EBF
MPIGTLYAEFHEGQGWPAGPDSIFLGNNDHINDFYCTGIGTPEASSSHELFERERQMDQAGAAFPVDLATDREGLYDDSLRYLVWDIADVAAIVTRTAWFDAEQGEWNGTARFRIRKADGTIRWNDVDEEDARMLPRPGDTVERLWERHESDWRAHPGPGDGGGSKP